MIEEAIVDAYGESEQIGGFYTTIDEHPETGLDGAADGDGLLLPRHPLSPHPRKWRLLIDAQPEPEA